MEKVRVYELAKELNTTSKRLMEKLAEIKVVVKNHMSLLEDDELSALYNHIGIIKHDETKKDEVDDKKAATVVQHKLEPNKDTKKDAKSAPRIIRKTEIIIDSKIESKDTKTAPRPEFQRNDYRNDFKGDIRSDVRGPVRNNQRHDYVKSADSNSGLMSGYRRDSGPDYRKDFKPLERQDANKGLDRGAGKAEIKHEVIPEVRKNVNVNMNKPEFDQETKASDRIVEDTKQSHSLEKVNQQIDSGSLQNIEPVINLKTSDDGIQSENKQPAKSSDYQQSSTKSESQGDRPYNRPSDGSSDRPVQRQNYGQNDRPAFRPNNSQGDRQFDNRQGERPSGDRPQGGYRPSGDRPQQGGYRPSGDRPQGGYRPSGDRPQGGYSQSGDRPQQGGYRPSGDRPQQGGYRPSGDRPQGGYAPSGDRPQGGYRPSGDRPQQGGYRPFGDRPQQGGYRPSGDRPQQGGYRPSGDRPQQGGYRPSGDRPQQGGYRQGGRSLDIPKPELSIAQKEELNSQRSEVRREFQNKDIDKDVKREQKRDVPKGQTPVGKNNRFKPQRVILSEKKGVSEILSDDFILEEFFTNDGIKKTRRVSRPKKAADLKYIPPRAVLTSIKIGENITVKDLAEVLKKTSTDVIKKLMGLGVMATLNHELDFDTATIIADEFGIKTEKEVVVNEEDILFDEAEDNEKDLEPRPPVVVVMGHVDHGKTSLLDAIRETNVIESEAGGITQHIGAYTVKINNRAITFLDTPGHEAFTAMRARGAQVTDVAILVVAADDGIMPQTIEAINHAKAANVSIIVAINKIDKPGANVDKVKQELTEYGLVAEEWGGDAICVPVSAKKRMNIDHLLEMVLLAADVLELKSNPNRQAKGTIIEAKLDKGRGPVATVLVQRGTLNTGDSVVTGTTVGRIRAMVDDKGHKVKKAGPSTPVEIIGLSEVPEAGEIFYAITDEKVAKQLAEKRKHKLREEQLKSSARVSLEDLYTQIKEGKVKDINIIVKADVQGSVEAVKQSLEKLTNDEVRVKIIHGGVGAITESDVILAGVSSAIIIGFNVRPGPNVAEAAENIGVDIRLYRVIYNAIDDIQAAMKGMLEPTFKEVINGHTEVRQIFKVSGVGTIAGCYVTDGKIIRNTDVRVVRNGIVVHEGKLSSLKRFKDDAKEVAQGYECGLSIDKFNDIKEGDIIESYSMEEVAR